MCSGQQQPTCQLHWQSSTAANGEQENDQADSGDKFEDQVWSVNVDIRS